MSVLIIASAGSGKTTRFIQMLREQIRSGTPYDQIQILMFSKNAKCDFEDRIKRENAKLKPKDRLKQKQVNINTIHSLAYYITKTVRNRGTDNDSFLFVELLVISAIDLIKNKTTQVFTLPKIKNLKFLYVDEAQDLNATEYQFICLLQEHLGAKVCMVGDPKQTIFQMKSSDHKLFLQHSYDATETLPNNYRSQEGILTLAHSVARQIDSSYQDQICTRTGDSHKPTLFWGNSQFLLKRICDVAKQALCQHKSVGVIGCLKVAKGYNRSLGLQQVRRCLKQQKIQYFVHFQVQDDQDTAVQKKQVKNSSVNLMTVHQSKGLEFDIAIFIDPQHRLQTRLPSTDDLVNHNNLIYVGVTRAKEQLHMFLDDRDAPHSILHIPIRNNLVDVFVSDELSNYAKTFVKSEQEDDYFVLTGGQLQKASETDVLVGLSKNIVKRVQLDELMLSGSKQFGIYNTQSTGIASNIRTWDQRPPTGDVIHHTVNELIGFYIQQGLTGDVPGLTVTNLDCGVQFPSDKEYFFDPEFKKHQFQEIHKRKPNKKEEEELEVIQQELSELACVSGWTMEDLFQYCLNDQSPSRDGAQLLLKSRFSEHLHTFAKLYQAFYLKEIVAAHWNTIQEQLMDMYDVYCQLRESPLAQALKGKSKRCGNESHEMPGKEHYVNFNIVGVADVVNDQHVIELKFAKDFRCIYYSQLLMYAVLLGPPPGLTKSPLDCETHTYLSRLPILFNIRKGIIYQLNVTTKYMAGFIKTLQRFTNTSRHVITYDFETTGLDAHQCEIIEYCFYDANTRTPICSSLVKPRGRIPEQVEQLTGITNQMVQSAPNPIKLTEDFNQMRGQYSQPCLVAHNGNIFDSLILKRYAQNLGFSLEGFSLHDSLYALRLFGSDKESTQLQNIYKSIYKKEPAMAHRATADCEMLATLINHFDIINSFSRLKIAQDQ